MTADLVPTEKYVRSRYLLLSPTIYQNDAGHQVRMGYSTRLAKLIEFDPDIAQFLASDELWNIRSDDLAPLLELGLVTRAGVDELHEVVSGLQATSNDPSHRQIVLMPTSYCNMACSYCGQEHHKAAVNEARVSRIISRVRKTIEDPVVRSVEVGWFGGEPLLAIRVIREMSAEFTAAASRLGKIYTAKTTTNGSLLTSRTLRMLYADCNLRSLEITIDGPEEVHNRRRLKKNGTGSFSRIVAVLSDAVRHDDVPGMKIGIRVNIDLDNEGSVPDLIADLVCFGLAAHNIELHLVPVHSWGNDVSDVQLEATRYARREMALLNYAHALGLNVIAVPNHVKRTTCITTTPYGELIDSSGRMYACTEHPLVPGEQDRRVIATVDELGVMGRRPAGIFDDWYERVAAGAQQCSRCPLLPVCGGHCPKLWADGHVPCPSMKFGWTDRMDLAIRQLGYTPLHESS